MELASGKSYGMAVRKGRKFRGSYLEGAGSQCLRV